MWGAVLVAMAAMFVAALAVPDAFGRHGVAFGVAFLIVTVMHLTLYALAARGDRDLLAAILRIAPSSLAGAALILAAGFVDGAAKAAAVAGRASSSASSGRCSPASAAGGSQPAHFVERHGLIVIIAIGESLVAIGLGRETHRTQHRGDRRRRARVRRRDVVLARVLRLLPDPGAAAARRPKRRRSAPPWRATSTPTCTCRWWPASSSSRSR